MGWSEIISLEGFLKQQKRSSKVSSFLRGFFIVFGVAGIFVFGVAVGQGRVSFGNKFVGQSRNTKLPNDLDYSSVETVYDTLRASYDGELKEDKILDGIKAGLAEATGDPYTEYMNADAAQQFKDDLNGTFSGIGAELGKEKDFIVIVSPIAGFPAEKAGLKPKDIVTEINGESAYNLTITEAVTKIRGEKGTEVTLKVIRDQKQELEFKIVRETIKIPSVESEILEGNIGYLKISRFSEDTVQLSREAANKFEQANVKGVILDVRSDPGGLLDASISVASIWLPKGKTVLQEKRGEVVIRTYTASGGAILEGVPTVVLINGGSASASEIVAGALKDNKAAAIIGEKSFGKGSVQQLEQLRSGGVLKVTIARWYTPGGKNIDKEGITPDQEIKRSEDDITANRDPQKDKAIELLKK
jgi:carboxyl-terminal processing protease